MKPENFLPTTESRLEKAKSNFEDWRSSRKNRSRIPEALWKKAVALYPEYTVGKISSTLRLSYTDLKKRIGSRIEPTLTSEAEGVPAFIEVGFSPASSSLDC